MALNRGRGLGRGLGRGIKNEHESSKKALSPALSRDITHRSVHISCAGEGVFVPNSKLILSLTAMRFTQAIFL